MRVKSKIRCFPLWNRPNNQKIEKTDILVRGQIDTDQIRSEGRANPKSLKSLEAQCLKTPQAME